MKFFSTTVLIVLIHIICLGQSKRNCNWAFGDSVGLNFSTTIPTVDTNYVLYTKETSSSISDSSGNLLFYAGSALNGSMPPFFYQITVWNNQKQVMPNGDSLIGEATVTQGTLILPTLYDTSLYYVFTIGTATGSSFNRYLYYSIVDMKLDSGRGDVAVKNVQLTNFEMSEKMTVVRHGNGRDWWLITHDGATDFVIFLITPSGINGPYFQTIGTALQGSFGNIRYLGQICISPDGTKLCMVGLDKVIDLFDFERCSGTLSNWIYLGDTLFTNSPHRGTYGCSFSPNSKVLYVSTLDTLFQYDLSAANIAASCITIHAGNCQDTCQIGQHQIAPNGYIYIGNYSSTLFAAVTIYNSNISYIENPDVVGFGCGFHYLGQYLNGRISLYGLPNMANYDLGRDTGSVCDTLTNLESVTSLQELITLKPNPAKDEVMISSSEPIKNLWILNIQGEMIFERKNANVFTEKINTTGLSNGVYMVRMETGMGIVVKKLVVLRK